GVAGGNFSLRTVPHQGFPLVLVEIVQDDQGHALVGLHPGPSLVGVRNNLQVSTHLRCEAEPRLLLVGIQPVQGALDNVFGVLALTAEARENEDDRVVNVRRTGHGHSLRCGTLARLAEHVFRRYVSPDILNSEPASASKAARAYSNSAA